jgi:hypothetical protein
VIDQGIGGIPTPGNASIKPDKTTTYTLTATGCGGTLTKQVVVTVNPSNTGNLGQILPGALIVQDLAITKMYLVTMTGPSKLHVDVKNTGTVDFNGNFDYQCAAPYSLKGTGAIVGALGDAGTINRSIPKGGTAFFDPIMNFDATIYSYLQVVCVVKLAGDPTPDDNTNVTVIP